MSTEWHKSIVLSVHVYIPLDFNLEPTISDCCLSSSFLHACLKNSIIITAIIMFFATPKVDLKNVLVKISVKLHSSGWFSKNVCFHQSTTNAITWHSKTEVLFSRPDWYPWQPITTSYSCTTRKLFIKLIISYQSRKSFLLERGRYKRCGCLAAS